MLNRDSWSWLAAVIIVLSGWGVALKNPPANYMAWDAFGYYLYLPATFIYDDPSLNKQNDWLPSIYAHYEPSPTDYQVVDIGRNKRVIKYPLGKALVDLPAFGVGHAIASLTDAPADGFSKPYQYSLWIWNLLLLSFGVLILRATLRLLFSDKVTALLLLLICVGTNYLLTAWLSSGLVHGLLFGLHAAMLYFTFRLWKVPTQKAWMALLLVLAAMCIMRPTEVVVAVIPLGVLLPKYIAQWRSVSISTYLKVVFPALLVGSLQLIYWKFTSNQWLFYSYNNAGEGLDLWQPHTLDFLFSFRKGWLLYTPLFILLVPGFFALFRWEKSVFWPILISFSLFLWISSSWSNWWYAESFSQRPMVQFYPTLAIVLGALWVRSGQTLKRLILVFGFVCFLLNVFQSWQFTQGILHPSRMTADYYEAIFGQTTIPERAQTLLLVDRSFSGGGQAPFDELDFQSLPVPGLVGVSSQELYPFETSWPMDSLLSGAHFWVRAKMSVLVEPESSSGASPKLHLSTYATHHEEVYAYQSVPWELQAGTSDTTVYFLSPEPTRQGDRYYFQLWNPNEVNLRFMAFELEYYAAP